MKRYLPFVAIALWISLWTQGAFGQTHVLCSPGSTTLYPWSSVGYLSVQTSSSGNVTFKFTGANYASGGVVPDSLNYIVIIPSSGTVPATLTVGINRSAVAYLKPGLTHTQMPHFEVGPAPGGGGGCAIEYAKPAEPMPSVQSVVNSASLQSPLSPGAMVSIFGSYLTGPTLSTTYDFTALYPTSVANTSVTFNGIAAPLLYLSPGQINAIVPFGLAGQTSAKVVVKRFEWESAPVTVALQDTSPAIFTASQGGRGQGSILQQGADGQFTYNSSGNPAAKGTTIEIFATGMGLWTGVKVPPPQCDVSLFFATFQTQPVSVTIGSQPARVLSAGTIRQSLSSWSVLQVNAIVPDGAGSGQQPVVLKIGANDNAQQGVTMWVQ